MRHFLCLSCLCLFAFLSCDDSEPAEIVSARYVDEITIQITLRIPSNPTDYQVADDTLSIYSLYHNYYHRVTAVSSGPDNTYTITLRRPLTPDDRVRVNGHYSLTGSVTFDVP